MRKADDESSLELLLDTVCNMFGGIVLIAILLALISQSSGSAKRPPPTPVGTVTKGEEQRQSQTISNLEAKIAELEAKIGKVAVSDTAATRRLQEEVEKLNADIRDLTIRKQERERMNAVNAEAKSNLERVLPLLTNELARLDVETRTVQAPRVQAAGGKRAVFLALKGRRLYAIHDISGAAPAVRERDYNLTEITLAPQVAGSTIVHLKAGVGQTIVDNCEREGTLARALQHVSATKEFFSIAVFPDSYREFNYVKKVIVAKGYRYYWVPLPSDDTPIEINSTAAENIRTM